MKTVKSIENTKVNESNELVVVIHGRDEVIYIIYEGSNDKIPLAKITNNIYKQPGALTNPIYHYCTDAVREDFWRVNESSDNRVNHIFNLSNTVLTPPGFEPVITTELADPTLRPIDSELFDENQMCSIILNTENAQESFEYTRGTCSFISMNECHVDLPCKIQWAGQGSSDRVPHHYKINLDDTLNGYPIIYAKNGNSDWPVLTCEKLARDIAYAIGCLDLKSSYIFLSCNGNANGMYILLERYSKTNMAAFIGHTEGDNKDSGSFIKPNPRYGNSILGTLDETTVYSIEHQNSSQPDIFQTLKDDYQTKLSDPTLTYSEFTSIYNSERMARSLALQAIICLPDSIFQNKDNLYYSLSLPENIANMHLWDLDHCLLKESSHNLPSIENIEGGYMNEPIPELQWCLRYPEFIKSFQNILATYINSNLPTIFEERIQYFATQLSAYGIDTTDMPPNIKTKNMFEKIIKDYLKNSL